MTQIARNVLLLAALSASCACSSGSAPVDIGDSRTGQKLEDYAAHWEGYVEASDFSDGSDQVKLTLDATGNGTLEIGDSTPLPPITDRDATPYGVKLHAMSALVPGVSYAIHAATVESARIRFSVNPHEVDRDWCALQTSYPANFDNGVTVYACVPPDGSHRTTGRTRQQLCHPSWSPPPVGRFFCSTYFGCTSFPGPNLCSCDAQGCSVFEYPGTGYGFSCQAGPCSPHRGRTVQLRLREARRGSG